MKQLTRYGVLLILALVIGIGIYAVVPADAAAYVCGDGCRNAWIGCNGQGSCDPGLYAYGVFKYGPPGVCNTLCAFQQTGCVDPIFCQ